MAETVRIEPTAHAALAEIARAKHVTLTEALSRAVEAFRREVFFEQMSAAHDEVCADPKALAAEEAERALWDRTNLDGLENEPPHRGARAGSNAARVTKKSRSPSVRRR
jgi:hypothetical protein